MTLTMGPYVSISYVQKNLHSSHHQDQGESRLQPCMQASLEIAMALNCSIVPPNNELFYGLQKAMMTNITIQ